MVQKILNNIITGNRFLSVEVRLEEDQTRYHTIELRNKNNSLSIESSATYTDFEDLIKNISKNQPVLLSFTGQGIISKKIENTANFRSKILFNANPEDFYWYEFTQADHIYASVIRKSVVDDRLKAFNQNQIYILDFSIGPLVVSSIKQLFPDINSLFTQNYKLDYSENILKALIKQENQDATAFYELEEEKIALNDIIPFANLVHYLFPSSDIASERGFLNENKKEYGYRKAFNILGMFALPSFLLTLLISYFLLGHYQKQFIDLQVQLEEKNIAHNKQLLLEKDRDSKEAMLKESGLNNSNFLSYYVSEITREIPVEINLVELNVFSPTKKIKPGQRIVFNNDEVIIKGTAVSNNAFANWIKEIKEYKWIDNLEIVDFGKNGSANSFEIQLKLKFNV